VPGSFGKRGGIANAESRARPCGGRGTELRALTEGFKATFAVVGGIAALGVLLALVLFRSQPTIESETLAAVGD
jgi:hypothetical protein